MGADGDTVSTVDTEFVSIIRRMREGVFVLTNNHPSRTSLDAYAVAFAFSLIDGEKGHLNLPFSIVSQNISLDDSNIQPKQLDNNPNHRMLDCKEVRRAGSASAPNP